MKKILFALMLAATGAQAQTYTLTAGTNTITLNRTTYPLDALRLDTFGTKAAFVLNSSNLTIAPMTAISSYKRSSGNAFVSIAALRAFYDSMMVHAK